MAGYREALAVANKLSSQDRQRLCSALTEFRVASLTVCWSAPVTLAEARAWPEVPGIYSILREGEYGYFHVVRIGATHDASRQPGNYNPKPFGEEPRLRLAFAEVPAEFRAQMAALASDGPPRRLQDVDWLEQKMEHRLLEAYKQKWGTLPPANFRERSFDFGAAHINFSESGALEVIECPPARVSESVVRGLRQSVM